MNIDLITIFKVVLAPYLVVALKLNQPLFLLHCYHFSNIRSTLLNNINLGSIVNLDYTLVKIVLYEDQSYSQEENSYIINAIIKYLVNSDRWPTSVVSYDLNPLNVFMILCFFKKIVNLSAYDKLSGASLCISEVLSIYIYFLFSCIVNVC